jgi:DNA modification methylase
MKMNQARIVVGDNRNTLKSLESGSVQTCITSPPYWGLRDYGEDAQIGLEQTPAEYVEELCKVFDEVWRVLADDGTLWLNIGDSYTSVHTGGQKSAKSTVGANHDGAQEIRQNKSNPKTYGLKDKELVGIPWRVAFALQERGWYLRQDIIWAKPNPMPESVTDRCTKSHEYIFLLTKQPNYFFDHLAIKEKAKTEPKARDKNAEGYQADYTKGDRFSPGMRVFGADGLRNKRDVWNVNTSRYKGAHFATYPPELVEPCVLAGSREGDWVLDPFNGSGTTGVVALAHNRNYIGLELNADYADLALARISDSVGMMGEVSVINNEVELEKATSES